MTGICWFVFCFVFFGEKKRSYDSTQRSVSFRVITPFLPLGGCPVLMSVARNQVAREVEAFGPRSGPLCVTSAKSFRYFLPWCTRSLVLFHGCSLIRTGYRIWMNEWYRSGSLAVRHFFLFFLQATQCTAAKKKILCAQKVFSLKTVIQKKRL